MPFLPALDRSAYSHRLQARKAYNEWHVRCAERDAFVVWYLSAIEGRDRAVAGPSLELFCCEADERECAGMRERGLCANKPGGETE